MAANKELTNPDSEFDAPSSASNGRRVNQSQHPTIVLPRWIVYFQAALLGVIATTFFIFGLMVGSLTSGTEPDELAQFDCQISGVVEFQTAEGRRPDEGAVVMLLPKNGKPEMRAQGALVSPAGFQALDNLGIENVTKLGGAVVRADRNGEFNVEVSATGGKGIDYFLLVVSRNVANESGLELSKQERAGIGNFFMPVERVVDGQAIDWRSVTARSSKMKKIQVSF
jgi:hypothetical protein